MGEFIFNKTLERKDEEGIKSKMEIKTVAKIKALLYLNLTYHACFQHFEIVAKYDQTILSGTFVD